MVAALLAGILGSLVPVGKASAAISAGEATLSTALANTTTQVTYTFTTGATSDVPVGGNVEIAFPTGWQLPSSIPATAVSLNGVSSSTAPIVSAATRKATVFWGGAAAMPAQSGNVLLFSSAAGIKTPKKAAAGGTFNLEASGDTGASPDATDASTAAITAHVKFASATVRAYGGAARGTTVDVTGEGYGTSTGINITITGSSVVIGTGSTDGSGTVTASFVAGGTTYSRSGQVIIVSDGKGNVSGTTSNFGAGPTFTQLATATSRTASARVGQTVSVDLLDYTASGSIAASSTTIGGTAALSGNSNAAFAIPATGGSSFNTPYTFVVPSTTTGTKTVVVTDGTKSASFTFDVTASLKGTVAALPTSAVASQKVTLTGTSFTASGSISANAITITGGNLTSTTTHSAVSIDSGGSWVAQVTLPATTATLTPGSSRIYVTDGTKTGLVYITIPERAFTVSSTAGARGDTVTFNGSGYAASSTVTVKFGSSTVATVTANASGDVTGTFKVPLTANIPSTNVVSGTSSAGGAVSLYYKVGAAAITVNPTTATSGSSIVINGSGFPAFSAVSSITIGTLSATPLPAPSTDGVGNFTASVLVPQVAAGTQAIVATIGTTTASASFTVGAGSSGVVATTALAALTGSGNFEIASSFNYTSGAYEAFINQTGDKMTTVKPNSVLILTMTADTDVIVSGVKFSVKANTPTPIPVGANVTITVV